MKIIHWVVVFVFVVIPFSLVCKNTVNNRFVALKDEVRINNAIDTATYDAVDLLIEIAELDGTKNIELNPSICEAAIKQFYNTMAVNYNMPYNDETVAYLDSYIPAIIIVGYDGFYVYSAEVTNEGVKHVLKPKIPYSYKDSQGNVINFTLDNYATVYVQSRGRTYSGRLYDVSTYKNERNNQYNEEYKPLKDGIGIDELYYVTDNLSFILDRILTTDSSCMIDTFLTKGNPSKDYIYDANGVLKTEAGEFHKKRREVITGLIQAALEEEVMQHNSFTQLLGVDYTFNIPEISKDEWINAIDDISVLSFIQGIPIGVNEYYNNYALGGSRITRGNYFYGGTDGKYHREGCSQISDVSADGTITLNYDKIVDIFINKHSAAIYKNEKTKENYYWCPVCKP